MKQVDHEFEGLSHNLVKATGPSPCRVLMIGESPGHEEDEVGRCFCLETNTRVLTVDLRWIPIGSVSIGDKLVAFDETPPSGHPGISGKSSRKYRVSTVTQIHKRRALANTYTTDKGIVTGTPEHRVLTRDILGNHSWHELGKLSHGRYGTTGRVSGLSFVVEPWDTHADYNSGWLAGFFDGEGCISQKRSSRSHMTVSFAQNSGETCDEAVRRIAYAGFQTHGNGVQRNNCKNNERHRLLGGFRTVLKFLGSVRPNRLLSKAIRLFEADKMPDLRTTRAKLLSRSEPFECDVVDITTTTGTFIAEGFAVHNCGKTGRELDKFYLPLAMLRRPEVRVTNLIPVHPVANRNPTIEEIKFFSPYLKEEIETCKPEIIVPLGAFATRYFLGDVDLHTVHGLPHKNAKYPDAIILPTHHPAAGLHNSDTQPLIVFDFQQIRYAIEGTLPPREIDQFLSPAYVELTNAVDMNSALSGIRA